MDIVVHIPVTSSDIPNNLIEATLVRSSHCRVQVRRAVEMCCSSFGHLVTLMHFSLWTLISRTSIRFHVLRRRGRVNPEHFNQSSLALLPELPCLMFFLWFLFPWKSAAWNQKGFALVALQLGDGDLVRGCPGLGGVRHGAAHRLAGAHHCGLHPGTDAVSSSDCAVPLDRALVAVHLPAALAPLHGVADRSALRYPPWSPCFRTCPSRCTEFQDRVLMSKNPANASVGMADHSALR